VICPFCGVENRPGRRFCGKCGSALAGACPSCGAANDADESFCGQCGTPLHAEAQAHGAPPSAPTSQAQPGAATPHPESERRHVSVLFADLVGFTSMSDDRDAEDVRELLSQYFATARTVIARYGGSIEKFIGDAVMAVWGVPQTQEDDAERAVRAALELVDAVSAFGEAVGAPGLRARAGVLTGEAAVTLGATGEGMVAGDMVNTASRVQSAAAPGTVLVGETTWRTTQAAIRYEDAGTHPLKGKPDPVHLWRASGVLAARGGALRPSGLEPPFVGRERELRVLKEFLHATSEEGRARLLSIIGVAGVGKSRLAWEFEKYVDGLMEGIWWHRGRCLSYGEGVAYSALAEMVRMRAGIAENEAAESAHEKLITCVESFLPDAEERRWVSPRLAQLLGLEEFASSDPRDLYAAWRVFFERVAAEGLVVLLFGDLQWADPGLLDFIDYLMDWSRTSPILVLTLSRPELAERRPDWGSGKRAFTSLYLEPLSDEAMKELLAGLVPGLPEEVSHRIRDQAAGIPLYAVETVRMLLDRGLVVEHDGAYRTEGSLQELEVPESLHALIAARLDSLGLEERQLLQNASVLGKSFTPAALAAITGLSDEVIEPRLRSLLRKDLLAMQSDPRSPERGQYVFVQDLVRGVAYGTLARRDRKQRHLAVADYLTTTWGDEEEIAEVVASHLIAAYETDPSAPDAGELGDRARSALVRAAQHASGLGAPESACRYYERALELAPEDARAELSLRAGGAAVLIGDSERAVQHLELARELFRASGQALGEARALDGLCAVAAASGQRDRSGELCEEALAVLDRPPESDQTTAAKAKFEVLLARNHFFLGHLDEALAHVERALRVADRRRLWPVLALGLDTRAIVLATRGRLFEAQLLSRAALRIAEEHDLLGDAARIATSLGTQLEDDDQVQASLEAYEQAEVLARRRGDRRQVIGTRLNKISDLLELGRWDEVAAISAEFIEVDVPDLSGAFEMGGLFASAVWLFVRRGEIAAARRIVSEEFVPPDGVRSDLRALHDSARAAISNAAGDHEAALTIAEATLRANQEGLTVDVRFALIEGVDAAFEMGRDDKVAELITVVRDHAGPGLHLAIDAHLLRYEARLSAERGTTDDVDSQFRSATDAFLALDRPFWVAVTRLEHAEALVAQQREPEARELLALARATFAELRATPWIERADAAAIAPAAAEGGLSA
jgi:class 3 adenylate cyclase/tetratricopeptide (TPR) repeat protein